MINPLLPPALLALLLLAPAVPAAQEERVVLRQDSGYEVYGTTWSVLGAHRDVRLDVDCGAGFLHARLLRILLPGGPASPLLDGWTLAPEPVAQVACADQRLSVALPDLAEGVYVWSYEGAGVDARVDLELSGVPV